jgi:hypothetical protein
MGRRMRRRRRRNKKFMMRVTGKLKTILQEKSG